MASKKAGVDFWEGDLMDRQPSAKFLTNYLLANSHVKVLNVNSPWGSGKSFFLQRWSKALSEDHVCVNFNAWDSDYTTEPLVALISCIEQQVMDPLALESTKVGKGIINVSSALIKKAGPLIMKGLVKKFSGVEIDELIGDGAGDAADDVIKALIEEQAETKGNVEEFKKEVRSRLASAASNQGKKAPAFIFIDELDRCRPTYAIELLERIKHFFELDDCRFIIASDSAQLAHSIRAVYGEGFASERYLNRFFDVEFNLDNQDIFSMVHHSLPEINSLKLGVNISGKFDARYFRGDKEPKHPQKNTVVSDIKDFSENAIFVVGLCRYFDVELRELVNYLKQIKSAADSIDGAVHFFWLAFLVFYKNSKHEGYGLLFDREKGAGAFTAYNESRPGVTFSFTTTMQDIDSLVSFYLSLLNADSHRLREMGSRLDGWKTEVYYSARDNIAALQSYKKIVELAHRLS
ncbi:KAP family NTPase [Pseudomonas sp. HN2]|uniref:KAP family P-loop NTPase fold protein n=1 Tax=Pseudomonas sp. HN2 TaxID=2884805 RepID=UPI001D1474C0|nr:P-loop NTPase fold protein [Pseudomonas sp. HN2]UEB94200.1 KAP family NTPase [Pseudomonas sp. HN2]